MATTDENDKRPAEAEGARDLTDKELEAVSGGAVYDEQGRRVCPECGCTDIRYVSHSQMCMNCGYMGC